MSLPIIKRDVYQVISLWKYCLYRAYIQLKLRHRNTRLGLLWEPIFLTIVATVLSIVWSQVLGVKKLEDFLLYVLVGLAVWQFISALINRGVNLIRGYSNAIINSREPVLSYVLSDILYEVMVLALKTPVLLIVSFTFGALSIEGILVYGYGMVLIVLSAIGFTLSFGFLAAFVGDFRELISTLMRLSFLITPVIWEVKRLGEYQHLVYFNPFYSYLSICRSPLLGEMPQLKEVVIASSLTVVLLGAGLYIMSTKIVQLKQKAFEV